MRMQEYLNQARHLQSEFDSFSLHQIPRSRNTHAPLPLLQPLQCRVYLGLSWSRIYATLPRRRWRWFRFINIGWDLVGWILLSYSLGMTSCPMRKGWLTKYEERLLNFGCPRTKSYTSALFWGHICCASTLK